MTLSHFFADYGLFILKTLTFVAASLFLVANIINLKSADKRNLTMRFLNAKLHDLQVRLLKDMGRKKTDAETLWSKKPQKDKPNAFILDFQGDIKASQVESLREEVSAILAIARPNDQVIIRLESPGGAVNGYGLAASQLQRLKDKQLHLTVCVDKVAASGGYLMACIADRILAAPYAIIGSIGVVAQFPNFHRWLKKHNIDVELLTAGEFKRTLTMFGENDEKARDKFLDDLKAIHQQFRTTIASHRTNLDIEKVATGEYWLAAQALELGLVDTLLTSDDLILTTAQSHNVYQLRVNVPQSPLDKLLKPAAKLLHPFA